MKYISVFLSCILLCIATRLQANNIQIDNISLTNQNTAQGFTMVEFDLGWDNSWRISVGPANWDAAWVFVKYRVNNGNWKHAALNYINGTNDGHNIPSGYTIRGDNKEAIRAGTCNGVYIYRSVDGNGKVRLADVQLRWNYASDGVADTDLVDVKVFAIEMVYVPQGAFELGSPAPLDTLEKGKFYTYPNMSDPYTVSSESGIVVGTANGNLYYDSSGDQAGPIPAKFPKGFAAFYCMKYEVSQEQWLGFFNLLTPTQQHANDITRAARKGSDQVVARNGIRWIRGNATTPLPYVPMSYLHLNEMAAYMDWASLRFMTEFEYEKACRGNLPSVTGEFAWGTSKLYSGHYSLMNPGTAQETVSNPGINIGNVYYGFTRDTLDPGPFRCGIFAASANTPNREETGGSFYGIMELSGNVVETVIHVGNIEGRSYTGLHGNGIINSLGHSSVSNWPVNGFGVANAMAGLRGGGILFTDKTMRVANRAWATSFTNSSFIGFRGVRTAP
jgi:formylglycine-generating enzyme required for sulfatase activity